MAAFGSVIGQVSPELLVTTINQQLNQASPTQTTIYQDISVVADAPGEQEVFPMNLAAYAEVRGAWNEERDFSDTFTLELNCGVSPIKARGWKWNTIPDAYNTLRNPEDIVIRLMKTWDRQLAALINANTNCYDGTAMFNGTHPVNATVPGAGTYANDFLNQDLDEAGLTNAMDNLLSIKGLDGNRLNADLGTPMILVPTIGLLNKARHLINPGMIPVPVGIGGASTTTQLEGMATVRLMPELLDPNIPNSNKRWYLVRTNYGANKPLITRIALRPNLKWFGAGSGVDFKYGNGVVACGIDCVGGVNYGLPQLIIRNQTP
jgi:hypothetical protein